MKMKISFCEYQGGDFDLFIEDAETGESVTITGPSKLDDTQRNILMHLMPPCVMTEYECKDE